MNDAAVTLGLVGAGATFGGLAGGMSVAIALLLEGYASPIFFVVGAAFGAPIGVVVGPILALSLLRHVPLGRLFSGLSFGTILGGVLGWTLARPALQPLMGLTGAFIGCVVSAIILRYRTHFERDEED